VTFDPLRVALDDPDPDVVEEITHGLVQRSQAAVQVGHPESLEASTADLIRLDGGDTAPDMTTCHQGKPDSPNNRQRDSKDGCGDAVTP